MPCPSGTSTFFAWAGRTSLRRRTRDRALAHSCVVGRRATSGYGLRARVLDADILRREARPHTARVRLVLCQKAAAFAVERLLGHREICPEKFDLANAGRRSRNAAPPRHADYTAAPGNGPKAGDSGRRKYFSRLFPATVRLVGRPEDRLRRDPYSRWLFFLRLLPLVLYPFRITDDGGYGPRLRGTRENMGQRSRSLQQLRDLLAPAAALCGRRPLRPRFL